MNNFETDKNEVLTHMFKGNQLKSRLFCTSTQKMNMSVYKYSMCN